MQFVTAFLISSFVCIGESLYTVCKNDIDVPHYNYHILEGILIILGGYVTKKTHTHTTILRICGICLGQPGWAGTRRNIHPLHSSWSSIIPICFLHLLRHMASSVFNPRALQSFSTISLQVFFGLPLGLVPRKQAIKNCSVFPPHLTGVSTLPSETGNPEIVWTDTKDIKISPSPS